MAEDVTINAELDRLTNEILARVERISRDSGSTATPAGSIPQSLPATPLEPVVQPVLAASSPSQSSPSERLNEPAQAVGVIRRIDTPPEATPSAAPVVVPNSMPSGSGPRLWVATTRKNSALMTTIGQGLSYVGILGITLGLSLVVLGTFGAAAHLTPTGWLVATLGQMLLLLGIVTTVSIGMEQSSAEMRATIEERMRHIEAQLERLGHSANRLEPGHVAEPTPHFVATRQTTTAAQSDSLGRADS